MRQIRAGEVPFDGDRDPKDSERPVFRGNGPDDYVRVQCDNVLAEAMHRVDAEEGAHPLRDRQRGGDEE